MAPPGHMAPVCLHSHAQPAACFLGAHVNQATPKIVKYEQTQKYQVLLLEPPISLTPHLWCANPSAVCLNELLHGPVLIAATEHTRVKLGQAHIYYIVASDTDLSRVTWSTHS